MCSAQAHVRFTPNSDRESGHPQKVMSALPLKADMGSAATHVCFGPIADIVALFDQLVSAPDDRIGDVDAERLGSLQVDVQLDFSGLLDWQVGRLFALENSASVDSERTVSVRSSRSQTR